MAEQIEATYNKDKFMDAVIDGRSVDYIHLNSNSKIKNEFLFWMGKKDKGMASEVVAEAIKQKFHVFTTKDDLKSEVWIYQEGIYIPQGRSIIKEYTRELLEEWFEASMYNRIISKIEADTFIETEKFFEEHNPTIIPVKNGLLNVITGELIPFNPKAVFFTKLPIEYDTTKQCPMIDKFLREVLSKEEDIKIFYEIVGFCLLKDYRFEKGFMLIGDGRNGKGKSIELIKRLLGIDNCTGVPLSSLSEESFSVGELHKKLVNLAGDIGNRDLKETAMYKSLTGRDLVSAKRKFLRDLHFQNYAKFIFACNNLPAVYDMSFGFWSRWVLLEFPYTFVTQKEYDEAQDKTNLKIKDENIIEKITTQEELSGLLNQAMLGLHNLLEQKDFSSTRGSIEIKDLWMNKANSFVAFASKFLEEANDSRISKAELRKNYINYCKDKKVTPKSDRYLKETLQETFGASEERVWVDNSIERKQISLWSGIKWK